MKKTEDKIGRFVVIFALILVSMIIIFVIGSIVLIIMQRYYYSPSFSSFFNVFSRIWFVTQLLCLSVGIFIGPIMFAFINCIWDV